MSTAIIILVISLAALTYIIDEVGPEKATLIMTIYVVVMCYIGAVTFAICCI